MSSVDTSDLERLATEVGCETFDLMLVGDGSGSTLSAGCGWFVTAYERSKGQIWEHHGGTNGGTNNYAELEPFNYALWAYRHVLWHHHAAKFGQSILPAEHFSLKVLIVSDSEVTVRCGNGEYARRANAPLWATIEWFERKGYLFTWRHVSRNSNPFNKKADKVAGLTRKAIVGVPTD